MFTVKAIAWDDVPTTEVFPGIFRQALVSDDATVVRYVYHPGCVFPEHRHPESQITIVHSGEIEFTVDGNPTTLRAGEVAMIPGGVPHGARVSANEIVVTDNYIASADREPLIFDDGAG